MEAFFEWMFRARNDATLMELYSGLISWNDIPVDEPMLLEIVIESTTDELQEVVVTDIE
jgi:hypothetical protein